MRHAAPRIPLEGVKWRDAVKFCPSADNAGEMLLLTPRAANSGISTDPNLYREYPHLKIRRNATGDFQN
jgi:hypothetical protein